MNEPKHKIPADLSRLLESSGVEIIGHSEFKDATKYRLGRGTESASLNVFRTGNVSEEGKHSNLKQQLESWRLANKKAKRKPTVRAPTGKHKHSDKPVANSTPRVGTDEAGKGEYLGPLVVAGVRVLGEAQDLQLREAGVRDSKDLSNTRSRAISASVIEIVGAENTCILSLAPEEYGRRWKAAGSNVNRLLGELNVEIIDKLKDEVEVAVVDSFGVKARSYIEPYVPAGVGLEVRPKAEDDMAVAAASIIARARYLEEMGQLSGEVGFELPKGSTHVLEAARRVVDELGEDGLRKVAKEHFSITEKVLGSKSGRREG